MIIGDKSALYYWPYWAQSYKIHLQIHSNKAMCKFALTDITHTHPEKSNKP